MSRQPEILALILLLSRHSPVLATSSRPKTSRNSRSPNTAGRGEKRRMRLPGCESFVDQGDDVLGAGANTDCARGVFHSATTLSVTQ